LFQAHRQMGRLRLTLAASHFANAPNNTTVPSWLWTERLGHDPSGWRYHHSALCVPSAGL